MSATWILEAGTVTEMSVVNVFAQTVVDESCTLAKRISTHPARIIKYFPSL